MASKYTTQLVSGYNSTPPPDDGSQIASNVLKWSTHLTKIGDPILTLAQAINAAILASLDEGPTRSLVNYSVVAGDYNTTVEVDGTNVTLLLLATAGKGFRVRIKNTHATTTTTVTVSGGTNIDGAVSTTIPPRCSSTFIVNSAVSEYFEVGHARPSKDPIPTGTRMNFIQAAVPVGWTQVNTWNDFMIRAVSSALVGGASGGSWVISGLSGTQPNHTHGSGTLVTGTDSGVINLDAGGFAAATDGHTHDISGSVASDGNDAVTISSTGAWRPDYVNAIICSKN